MAKALKARSFSFVVILLALVVILGGLVFLLVWDAPPPATAVEKVIPDARFPR